MAKVEMVQYTDSDWLERDNFPTQERAAEYVKFLSRQHPRTPYRIAERDHRFVVEFVPEWNLRDATTPRGQREQEARRIARAEGFPIIAADEEWTSFTLGDGQQVAEATGQWPNVQYTGRMKTIHTHFSWVEESGRFEGFVS